MSRKPRVAIVRRVYVDVISMDEYDMLGRALVEELGCFWLDERSELRCD
jgi:hypothetical protein